MFTRRILFITAILAAALAALTAAAPVKADGPDATVSASVAVPLSVNGIKYQELPAQVALGSRVCVDSHLKYISPGERYRFDSWSFDAAAETKIGGASAAAESRGDNECIDIAQAGFYQAEYIPEVLFQVRSDVSKYNQSDWVAKGRVVDLDVPELVQKSGEVRFRFAGWNSGETPFTTENRTVALEPIHLEVRWVPEYLVTIETIDGGLDPASGWYALGDTVVIRAGTEVYDEKKLVRQMFERWEMSYGPLLRQESSPSISISVDRPISLRPKYTKSYLVEARNFQGAILREWVPEGDSVSLEAPPIVETLADRERYLFKEWEGALESEGATIEVVADQPLSLEAVYTRQFRLDVVSPFGASGDGWYDEGARTIIMAPEQPQSMLFFKRVFDGFYGLDDKGAVGTHPVSSVIVDQPMTVTAVYRSDINSKVMYLLFGVIGAGLVLYVGTELGKKYSGRFRRIRRTPIKNFRSI